MALEERARIFATERHRTVGQVRKYTNEPYINHPAAVVELVRGVIGHTEEMIAAAWLHDTVEDTFEDPEIGLLEISLTFGCVIAGYVEGLTNISKSSDGNREQRKQLDRQHFISASPEVKTIKLADVVDNISSIVERDPEFAQVYLNEKRLLLKYLKGGDAILWGRAMEIIKTGLRAND